MEISNTDNYEVLLFGITGGTGSLIARRLLAGGNKVAAVVRHPENVTLRHTELQIRKGDLVQPETYSDLVKNSDVVISAVGDRSGKPTTLYSDGVKNILRAMEGSKCKRLICISACPVEINPEMVFWLRWLMKYVVQKIFRHGYADLRVMESLIKGSDINWTIIRPPMLKDKPATDKYKIAINRHLRKPFSVTRADLANFIASIVGRPETFKSVIEIAN